MLVNAKCSSEMKKSKKSAATKPRVQQPYRFKSFKKASPAAGRFKSPSAAAAQFSFSFD
jgi:hypothetical protein